jgi:hypothetical protein
MNKNMPRQKRWPHLEQDLAVVKLGPVLQVGALPRQQAVQRRHRACGGGRRRAS